MEHFDVIVVGAGHAGANLALGLRQRRFPGTIALLGDEGCLPYERPPLSKEFLSGHKTFEQLLMRRAGTWSTSNIDVLPAERVLHVDPHGRSVRTQGGRSLGYGALVWAAGGRARRLECPGSEATGVRYIRTRADVTGLQAELAFASSIVIVGAGYIGLETAATLTKMGKAVTVIEGQSRVLARVAGEGVSAFYQSEHEARGVKFELNASVAALDVDAVGRVAGVRLRDGRRVEAGLVVVGIGIVPNVEVLAEAGAIVRNGVEVDAQCRSSLPDVYAIGDCAWHPNRYASSGYARLESVPNAVDQAATVAKVLSGIHARYESVPWFWSDQFDLKLQTTGISAGFDVEVIRGDPRTRAFSVVYVREGRVIALDCVNSGRDFVQGKQLVQSGARPALSLLASTDAELKSLVA